MRVVRRGRHIYLDMPTCSAVDVPLHGKGIEDRDLPGILAHLEKWARMPGKSRSSMLWPCNVNVDVAAPSLPVLHWLSITES